MKSKYSDSIAAFENRRGDSKQDRRATDDGSTGAQVSVDQQEIARKQAGRWRPLLLLTLAGIAIFHFSTLREGHDWGDDFAMYIRHSLNIVEGRAYDDTGFITNPNVTIGPRTYPPIFPIILSPISYFFGINLTAMKFLIVGLIIALLAFTCYCFNKFLSPGYRVLMVALIGFNPVYWNYKDHIVSDIPFALFSLISLCIIHRAYEERGSLSRDAISGVVIGLSIYLAYGTRSVGLVLIPCLIAWDLVRNRRPTLIGAIGTAVAALCIYFQNLTSHADGGYGTQIGPSLEYMADHSWLYFKIFTYFFENGYSKILKLLVFGAVIGLVVTGYVIRLLKGISVFEFFPIFYFGPFMILPIMPIDRYLVGLIPFLFLYALTGVRWIGARTGRESTLATVFVLLILGSYAARYTTLDFGQYLEGVGTPASRAMFDYIRKNTSPEDVFLFRKPRALALMTERSAACLDQEQSDEAQWGFIDSIKGSYLIAGPEQVSPEHYAFIRKFVDRNRDRFEKRYENSDFIIYRILTSPAGSNHNQ